MINQNILWHGRSFEMDEHAQAAGDAVSREEPSSKRVGARRKRVGKLITRSRRIGGQGESLLPQPAAESHKRGRLWRGAALSRLCGDVQQATILRREQLTQPCIWPTLPQRVFGHKRTQMRED